MSGQDNSQPHRVHPGMYITPRNLLVALRHPDYTETLNAPKLNLFSSVLLNILGIYTEKLSVLGLLGITQAATDTPPRAWV